MPDAYLSNNLYELPDGAVVANMKEAGIFVNTEGTHTLSVATNVVESVKADVVKAQADLHSLPDDWVVMCNAIYKVMLHQADKKGIKSRVWDFTKRSELLHYGPTVSPANKTLIENEFTGNGYTISWGSGDTTMTLTAP